MAEDPIKQVCHYAQALKAPRIRESAARLAEQARSSGWSHEEYLAAVLSREAAARESSGAETRIRSAGFPTRKSLEEFNFDHQPALGREVIAHLATGAFLAQARNVVLLGATGYRQNTPRDWTGHQGCPCWIPHRFRHCRRLGRSPQGSS
jgi:DNA replication protein DnaC